MTATSPQRVRPVDGKAIAAISLAFGAALLVPLWWLSAIAATAAISVALASRRALRQDPDLRGVTLGVIAFLTSVATLFLTLGPIVLSTVLLVIARTV